MAEHVHTTSWAPVPELVDMQAHPDAPLLLLCSLLGRLQTLTAELETVAAMLPAKTILGRRMKELSL